MCAVYSHMLLAIDNKEFYSDNETKYFPSIHDTANIAGFLNDIIYQLYTSYFSSRTFQARFGGIMYYVERLVGQLYDRNCRNEFLPAPLWHISNIPPSRLSMGIINNSLSYDIMLQKIPHVFSFESRAHAFQSLIALERDFTGQHQRVNLVVRRDYIIEDAIPIIARISGKQMRYG